MVLQVIGNVNLNSGIVALHNGIYEYVDMFSYPRVHGNVSPWSRCCFLETARNG
jgi:hypothetical protein